MASYTLSQLNRLKRVRRSVSFNPPELFSFQLTVTDNSSDWIESPGFKIEKSCVQFFLIYQPEMGEISLESERLAQNAEKCDLDRRFSFWIEVLDSNGKLITDFKSGDSWTVSEFTSESFELGEEVTFQLDIQATFICYIEMYNFQETLPQIGIQNENRAKLADELSRFVTEGPKDITIIGHDTAADEDHDFQLQVHSLIIKARSEVFRAMLEHDTLEKSSKNITIQDVSKEALTAMVDFLYTDTVKNLKDLALPLLILADKYAIEPLRDMCQCHILLNTNIGNVCSILDAADTINDRKLKDHCINFIGNYSVGHECPTELKEFFEKKPHLFSDFFFKCFKSSPPAQGEQKTLSPS